MLNHKPNNSKKNLKNGCKIGKREMAIENRLF